MRVPPTLSTVLGNLFKKPATNPPFPKSDPVPVPEASGASSSTTSRSASAAGCASRSARRVS